MACWGGCLANCCGGMACWGGGLANCCGGMACWGGGLANSNCCGGMACGGGGLANCCCGIELRGGAITGGEASRVGAACCGAMAAPLLAALAAALLAAESAEYRCCSMGYARARAVVVVEQLTLDWKAEAHPACSRATATASTFCNDRAMIEKIVE